MATKKRFTALEDAKCLLREETLGVLCTASGDGRPYGVPIHYVYDEAGHALICHCAATGRKLDNIRENGRVAFVVSGPWVIAEEKFTTRYASVLVEGRARIVEEAEEKRRMLLALCARLTPSAMEHAPDVIERSLPKVTMLKIDIDAISGKKNPEPES